MFLLKYWQIVWNVLYLHYKTYLRGTIMFIGREKELSKLTQLYNTNIFQFPVIYGRRRVGKTALINEFIKDKEQYPLQDLKALFHKIWKI